MISLPFTTEIGKDNEPAISFTVGSASISILEGMYMGCEEVPLVR